jgi:hypothetical protein
VEDSLGSLIISAVYLPPKHIVKQEQLETFYNTLGQQFIAGGDYNAKHTAWGSRLIMPRGREIYKTMEHLHLRHLSTGEPTFWPSDRNKLPDLLDFCVTKGIPPNSATATSNLDLSSDHSPVIVDLTTRAVPPEHPPRLSNRRTNWDFFRLLITERLTLNIPLKINEDIEEAVSCSMIPSNGLVGPQRQTLQPHSTLMTALHSSNINLKKNEDSANVGISQEHQKTNDYSTEQHGNLNNFSSGTEIPAFKLFYRALRRLRQLTIHYGKRLRN